MAADKTVPLLTGGCLCGAVRYEARPAEREGYYCHCRMCQSPSPSILCVRYG